MQCCNYTPEDIFWGQLGGCLEALDAGTTTVVDHAHMNYSPKHSKSFPVLLWKKVAEERGGKATMPCLLPFPLEFGQFLVIHLLRW
jgi:cytosine/adenosine deaminase-related metal-dependent hydrolase